MKKILLTLGAVAAVIAPISVIVSCGIEKKEKPQVEIPAPKTQIEASLITPSSKPHIEIPASKTQIEASLIKPLSQPKIIVPKPTNQQSAPSQPKVTKLTPQAPTQVLGSVPKTQATPSASQPKVVLPQPTNQQPTGDVIVPKGFDILNNDIFILDADDKPVDTKNNLMGAYGKFSKEINFESSNAGAFGALGSMNKVTEIDKTKKYIKVMLVGTQNNGNKVYYCGVMGYKPGTTSLYFLWRQFDSISGISDSASKGSFNDLRMAPMPTDSAPSFKFMASMEEIPQIVDYLVRVAKQEFPNSVVTLTA